MRTQSLGHQAVPFVLQYSLTLPVIKEPRRICALGAQEPRLLVCCGRVHNRFQRPNDEGVTICVQHMPSIRTLTAGCLARCESPTDNQYSPSRSRQIRLTGVLSSL